MHLFRLAALFLFATLLAPLSAGGQSIDGLQVDENGNVGVGISSLERDFVVSSESDAQTSLAVNNSAGGAATIGLDADGGQITGLDYLVLKQKSNLTSVIGNWADGPLLFKTNRAERLRINNDGKVGVGVSNPQTDLHVGRNTGANVSWSPQIVAESGGETGIAAKKGGEAIYLYYNGMSTPKLDAYDYVNDVATV